MARRRVTGIAVAGAGLLVLLALWVVPLPELAGPPSLRVLDRNGRTLRVFLAPDDQVRLPVALEAMSPNLVHAVITYEDRWFYRHPGLNPGAIVRALWLNARAGEVVSGGSTITQQLARMLDPRDRTLGAKALEAFRALQLELRYSKDEILAAYLNRAPYGGNIVGVEAAAWVYFGKPAAELGPGEAATLAAIPQSPSYLRPDVNPDAVRERRDEVLRRMLARGVISPDEHRRALTEPIPDRRRPFPLHAPHLTDDLAARHGARGGDLRTTVDLETQEITRQLLETHVAGLRGRGIQQAAAVVIDNESMTVRALVGSADYHDTRHDGQVNGVAAARSPGSALKPFVYAIALDRGLATPSSLLPDIPTSYGGYIPSNYDGRYQGMASLRDALRFSLNVPAVALVHEVGVAGFHDLLERGGLSTLTEGPRHYGLSLVLGGAGVRLDELTVLYAMLANGGMVRRATVLADQPSPPGERLLREETAWLVSDMLSDVTRPDMPDSWRAVAGMPAIAWKTGTSYGHRDAWSLGFTPRYTVGVWVGNFDGLGAPALVGAEAAGPLLFDILRALDRSVEGFARPEGIEERTVCTVSGQVPGRYCPTTTTALVDREVSPWKRCEMHVTVTVDDASGNWLCPLCRIRRPHHDEVRTVWPATVTAWRRAAGLPVEGLPAHWTGCSRVAGSEPPRILSPEAGVEYVLRQGVPAREQQVLLEVAVGPEVRRVFWFVDGALVHDGRPGDRVFWPPEVGTHEVVLLDEDGRRVSRTVVVKGT